MGSAARRGVKAILRAGALAPGFLRTAGLAGIGMVKAMHDMCDIWPEGAACWTS